MSHRIEKLDHPRLSIEHNTDVWSGMDFGILCVDFIAVDLSTSYNGDLTRWLSQLDDEALTAIRNSFIRRRNREAAALEAELLQAREIEARMSAQL